MHEPLPLPTRASPRRRLHRRSVLLRHARVRQWMREAKSLPLAQKQAGWSRLQMAYLTMGDAEARELLRGVTE